MPDLTLTPDLLLRAYANGIFPMAESRDDPELFWVDPQERGIFPLDGFHISKSLARRIRRGGYEITVNTAFAEVVEGCADRGETWINATISGLYAQLFARGHAQSLEVWQAGTLSGGIYGVSIGSAFFGESMFSRQTDASKIALAYLVDRLRQADFVLFDTQFLTPHLASLGAVEISRAEYRERLFAAIARPASFREVGPIPSPQELLQRMTQMS
jgi:leucyl/phenylalanyl-tRNA--protein transferase